MKKDFTLTVYAENNFNVLNRMINAFNRRRIRIRSLSAYEFEGNVHAGIARFIIHTTPEQMTKVRWQIEKFIEVERTELTENGEVSA